MNFKLDGASGLNVKMAESVSLATFLLCLELLSDLEVDGDLCDALFLVEVFAVRDQFPGLHQCLLKMQPEMQYLVATQNAISGFRVPQI